jgi:cytochrome c peroxidase
MKSLLIRSSLFGLVAGGGLLLSASAAEPYSKAQLHNVRTNALLVLSALPDRMPGAEKDTPVQIELGRKLYFDKQLSENKTQSCNTCHDLENGMAGVDNEPTSEGAFDKRGDRNSPTTLNAGFHFAQFWDGRAATLEEQAKGPILNPVEMAMPSEPVVVERLTKDKEYPGLFAKAFPDAKPAVSYDNLAVAIAAFERTLITHDRFDDFLKGDDKALKPLEVKGLEIFLDVGCTTCHNGPVLGGRMYQKVGLVNPYETPDKGRFTVTQDEDDLYKFKVPSLRNIALTFPYFHNGKIATLDEAVTKMGWLQLGMEFKQTETEALVAFLHSLSDKARVAKR